MRQKSWLLHFGSDVKVGLFHTTVNILESEINVVFSFRGHFNVSSLCVSLSSFFSDLGKIYWRDFYVSPSLKGDILFTQNVSSSNTTFIEGRHIVYPKCFFFHSCFFWYNLFNYTPTRREGAILQSPYPSVHPFVRLSVRPFTLS